MKGAQPCKSAQRVEARIGDASAVKIGLNDVRREVRKLGELGVSKIRRNVHGLEHEAVAGII
jgi:hypothetical protein